jgi:excisionase family DNA binding protein
VGGYEVPQQIKNSRTPRKAKRGRWLYVTDVMELAEISYHATLRIIQSGDLPAYKIGKEYKVKPDDFEAWLEQQRIGRS